MKTKSKISVSSAVYPVPVRLTDAAKDRITKYRQYMNDKYHMTISINSAINTLIELGWPIVAENESLKAEAAK